MLLSSRWLSPVTHAGCQERGQYVLFVEAYLPALVTTFEEIYNETGDTKVGIATLLTKYNTAACIYMLSDVLLTVAKLQGSLQGKEVDLDN